MVRINTVASTDLIAPLVTPFTRRMDRAVLKCLRRQGVITAGERLLVAVSGGPDSTALLLVLARLRDELSIELTVAHFDHMLRSRREAAEDEAFVRALAAALGLPVVSGRGNVAARARRAGQSIEEAARHLRYAFLAREARRSGCPAVALGHTRDDQAESVLMHLLRGSGLDGLAGMRPRAAWPLGRGPDAVRPLLDLPRSDTERYCREAGVAPRQDPTNALLIATRNRIRHELLPALRQFNPRVDEALARLGAAAAADVDFLDRAAAEAWAGLARRQGGAVVFDRQGLASLHPALAARLLRRAARAAGGAVGDLEAVHVRAVLDVLGRSRARIALPHGVHAVVGPRAVRIMRGEPKQPSGIAETRLAVPGHTTLAGWVVEAEVIPVPAAVQRLGPLEALLDADAVGQPLVLRSRRPGDRLRPLGLGGEKKVQDILVDAKVPLEERDRVPIVCAAWGIVWVVGHRIDERSALGATSLRGLHLRFVPAKGH